MPDFFTELAKQHVRNIEHKKRANLIRFFQYYKCPDINYSLISAYVSNAELNNLDYRILPSISIIESQCGKRYPRDTHNIWGWNSADSGFPSLSDGVAFISDKLAYGHYYKGKSLERKLNAYCPNPTYPDRIKFLMNQINN